MTHETSSLARCWAVVPAAGVGRRMGTDLAKQYLQLAGKTVIEHTVQRLLDQPEVAGIVVAIGADDDRWKTLKFDTEKKLITVVGGAERCHSVGNALQFLEQEVDLLDWILVHDAARPCVLNEDISRLIRTVIDSKVIGGVLGTPVRDTMKRTSANHTVVGTVDRANLWHAHTPQMFPYQSLKMAIMKAVAAGAEITDEASAMEFVGLNPLMVEGHAGNIKITHPSDLKVAEFFLQNREEVVTL